MAGAFEIGSIVKIIFKRSHSAEKLNGQFCIITDIIKDSEYVHVLPLDNNKYFCTGVWIDEIEFNGEIINNIPTRCIFKLNWYERLLKFLYE